MPRTCTVCVHERREEIDRELLRGKSFRNIALRFDLSHEAAWRHKQEHLPEHLTRSYLAEQVSDADALIEELETIKTDVYRLQAKAEAEGDLKTALSATSRAMQALELAAKMRQIINERPTVQIALVQHPEWTALMSRIAEALEPYPEAAISVAEELRVLEASPEASP